MRADSRREWSRLYRSAGSKSVLNDPDFIAILERVYRCESVHFVVSGAGGEFGIPAYRIATPMSGRKLTSSPFNFYPPLVGPGDDSTALRALIERAQGRGPDWYVEYKTFTNLPEEDVQHLGLRVLEPSVVSQLKLVSSLEEQQLQYKKSLRQNLRTTRRRAEEAGILIDWGSRERDLSAWYRLLVRLYRDKHQMICQPWPLYRELESSGLGRLLAARREGRVVGGIFILLSPGRWDYSWSAYDPDYARLGPNTLLVDDAITRAIEAGVTVFDFGSSSAGDEQLRHFKARWGCTDQTIKYYYWNHSPMPFDLHSSYSAARYLFSKLPLALLRRVPTVLVPYLG